MTTKQIAEGAFFVTPYYTDNIASHSPGLVNHPTFMDELRHSDDVVTEATGDLTKEMLDEVLRQVARSTEKQDKKDNR